MKHWAIIIPLLLGTSCRGLGPCGEKSISDRVADRDFPSVFMAWNPADNVRGAEPLAIEARHDLIWHGPGFFGLRWNKSPWGLADGFTPQSVPRALAMRKKLLERNPNVILLAEIRYRDAPARFLPPGHRWWKRGRDGQVVNGWAEGKFLQLDFTNPEYRAHVARRAGAAVRTGVFDGVLLDWWMEDWDRLQLVKAVRRAVGDDKLIVVNTNQRLEPVTAPYINGWFMECTRTKTAADWARIAASLAWGDRNLRPPRVMCLETWFHRSRNDRHLMRATTTLALTHSDGYCLFSDPNPLPTRDHLHDWYPFWDAPLGRPIAKGKSRTDGTFGREFDGGTVIHNPMGNQPVTVTFAAPRKSAATGTTATRHPVGCPDGDIFLKPKR